MVHLVGIGGLEFSVGRLADCRSPFTDSTLAALGLRMNLKIQTQGKHEESATPKTHHRIHSCPATATTSRRRAKTHVPRGSPYSPASIDTGLV